MLNEWLCDYLVLLNTAFRNKSVQAMPQFQKSDEGCLLKYTVYHCRSLHLLSLLCQNPAVQISWRRTDPITPPPPTPHLNEQEIKMCMRNYSRQQAPFLSKAKGTPEPPRQSCVNIMLKRPTRQKRVVHLGTVTNEALCFGFRMCEPKMHKNCGVQSGK